MTPEQTAMMAKVGAIDEAMAELAGLRGVVFRALRSSGMSVVDIAREAGISRQAVRRSIKGAHRA